ncbi:MAG: hypothetical protein D6800_12955 [Candidatus Zixiibacteriota bacterium]|nr:MAG: hypothetical protein D6800_12955 [candidate division Zixibacteria bacterium]
MQRILDTLVGYADKRITVRVDRKRLRPADIPVLRGSNRKAVRQLGWRPRYRLTETLQATLDYWRALERSR